MKTHEQLTHKHEFINEHVGLASSKDKLQEWHTWCY